MSPILSAYLRRPSSSQICHLRWWSEPNWTVREVMVWARWTLVAEFHDFTRARSPSTWVKSRGNVERGRVWELSQLNLLKSTFNPSDQNVQVEHSYLHLYYMPIAELDQQHLASNFTVEFKMSFRRLSCIVVICYFPPLILVGDSKIKKWIYISPKYRLFWPVLLRPKRNSEYFCHCRHR